MDRVTAIHTLHSPPPTAPHLRLCHRVSVQALCSLQFLFNLRHLVGAGDQSDNVQYDYDKHLYRPTSTPASSPIPTAAAPQA